MNKARMSLGASLLCLLGTVSYASETDEANRLFVLGKYDDATVVYQRIASSEDRKQAAEALFALGRAYQMLGQWKLAGEEFNRLLSDHPDSELVPASKIEIAQCEIKLGNLEKALTVFQEVEKNYPAENAAIEATYNIANLKAGFFGDDVKNARAAIGGYHRVLSCDRAKRYAVQSYFGLGQCYMLLRDYPRAINAFFAAVREGPDTIWAGYARDQIVKAHKVLGDAAGFKTLWRPEGLWPDLDQGPTGLFPQRQPSALHVPAGPTLRVRAVRFFTEPQNGTSAAQKVFYFEPRIYYKNYVFSSERGTVDRTRYWVECVGNVKCTDDVVVPTLTVTSGALTLDLGNNKALFSRDVRFERRTGPEQVQQLVVGELHLLLDSGNVEIPPE